MTYMYHKLYELCRLIFKRLITILFVILMSPYFQTTCLCFNVILYDVALKFKQYCTSFPVYIGSCPRVTTYATFNYTTWFPYTSSVHNTLQSQYFHVLTVTVTQRTRWTVFTILDHTWWVCHGNGSKSFEMKLFYSTISLNNCLGVYLCPSFHYEYFSPYIYPGTAFGKLATLFDQV